MRIGELACHNCGNLLEISGQMTRGDTCPRCSAFMRCCLNCDFYDETAYNQCHEPQAERVTEKEKANFCSFFIPGQKTSRSGNTRKAESLKKLNQLFKKK